MVGTHYKQGKDHEEAAKIHVQARSLLLESYQGRLNQVDALIQGQRGSPPDVRE